MEGKHDLNVSYFILITNSTQGIDLSVDTLGFFLPQIHYANHA